MWQIEMKIQRRRNKHWKKYQFWIDMNKLDLFLGFFFLILIGILGNIAVTAVCPCSLLYIMQLKSKCHYHYNIFINHILNIKQNKNAYGKDWYKFDVWHNDSRWTDDQCVCANLKKYLHVTDPFSQPISNQLQSNLIFNNLCFFVPLKGRVVIKFSGKWIVDWKKNEKKWLKGDWAKWLNRLYEKIIFEFGEQNYKRRERNPLL